MPSDCSPWAEGCCCAVGEACAAAEAGLAGTWHVVDDQPATVAEVLTDFAERLGAPAPRRVPVWLARLLAGKLVVNVMTTSTRTSNARIRQALGWAPRFPSYREGLDQVVPTWRAEGTLTPSASGTGARFSARQGVRP